MDLGPPKDQVDEAQPRLSSVARWLDYISGWVWRCAKSSGGCLQHDDRITKLRWRRCPHCIVPATYKSSLRDPRLHTSKKHKMSNGNSSYYFLKRTIKKYENKFKINEYVKYIEHQKQSDCNGAVSMIAVPPRILKKLRPSSSLSSKLSQL